MGINEYIQIGNKIKRARVEKGYTQKDVADKLNIPKSTYANYENNHREPNMDTLEAIAGVLGVTIDYLIGWDSNRPLKDNLNNSPIAAKLVGETIKKNIDGKIFQISYNTEDFTPEELLKIMEFAEFIKTQRDKRK
ncbi:transcriptional regulator with XRE-family HTH domain [Anaerotaenia torta]|uniref:helix-turn-helix domain-containing protein n=1 Tax=Anaerotaenia torta TaxID=433293 RepID=UPI003D1CD0BA